MVCGWASIPILTHPLPKPRSPFPVGLVDPLRWTSPRSQRDLIVFSPDFHSCLPPSRSLSLSSSLQRLSASGHERILPARTLQRATGQRGVELPQKSLSVQPHDVEGLFGTERLDLRLPGRTALYPGQNEPGRLLENGERVSLRRELSGGAQTKKQIGGIAKGLLKTTCCFLANSGSPRFATKIEPQICVTKPDILSFVPILLPVRTS